METDSKKMPGQYFLQKVLEAMNKRILLEDIATTIINLGNAGIKVTTYFTETGQAKIEPLASTIGTLILFLDR